MNPVRLCFCIHNHQPTGNFDSVIEQAYNKAYQPFLDLADEYPQFRFSMHISGCLLEWLEQHHPGYLDKLSGMIARGQVEPVGGAMYEPILPVWPDHLVAAQIDTYTKRVERRFGRVPQAFWLPERVWEPHLAPLLSAHGVRAMPVDDVMVAAAGITPDDLMRPLHTGPHKRPIRLFPVPERLRYTIPFRPVRESLEFLKETATHLPGALCTYADDGEKFGSWPGTHSAVFGRGWLRRFIEDLLAASSWLTLSHFSEALEEPAAKQIVLPAGTYREMQEWALAAGKAHSVATTARNRTSWRNFFSKYHEAERLHATVIDFARHNIDAHVLRAQCNCAYWHGVFGGVYLPHLRSALYEELAQSRAGGPDVPAFEKTDQGAYLSSDGLTLRCTPDHGGMLDTILQYDPPFNWGCTLTRRPESYHEKLLRGSSPGVRGPRSVHSKRGVERGNHVSLLTYDAYQRASLLDHFFKSTGQISRFASGELENTGDFVGRPYHWTEAEGKLILSRTGSVRTDTGRIELKVTKSLHLLDGTTFQVTYEVQAASPLPCRFGVEWNLSALAPTGPDRWVEVNDERAGEPRSQKRHTGVHRFGLVDAWGGKAIRIEVAPGCDLWRFGLHTVSQSERRFEQVYQQTVFLAHWPLTNRTALAAQFTVSLHKL